MQEIMSDIEAFELQTINEVAEMGTFVGNSLQIFANELLARIGEDRLPINVAMALWVQRN